MHRRDSFEFDTVRTRRGGVVVRAFRAAANFLLGRVGMSVCLKGRRETLYPRMSRREIRYVADTICRIAEDSAE